MLLEQPKESFIGLGIVAVGGITYLIQNAIYKSAKPS